MCENNLTQEEKEKLRAEYLRLDFPYAYGISLGEFSCIFRCRMCPMHNLPVRQERLITDKIFETACRMFGNRRGHSLEISAYGETFQHPRADDYLFLARKLCPNSEIVVATNGYFLDIERCEKIVDSGISHLSFSLDAGSAESHQWLTGSKAYDRLCYNLENLMRIKTQRKAKHLKVTTHIIGAKELEHEFDNFLSRWSDIVDFAYVRNLGDWGGLTKHNGISPLKKQVVPEERYPCPWLWHATKIEPNGDVSKCFVHVTGDEHPIGNIMEQDFTIIWSGERINTLRRLHCTSDIENLDFCPNCSIWTLYTNFWNKCVTPSGKVIWS